jgi:hypothetical protein
VSTRATGPQAGVAGVAGVALAPRASSGTRTLAPQLQFVHKGGQSEVGFRNFRLFAFFN